MNKNDLIKKLENLNLPKVELPSHQLRLKMALLNSDYFRKQTTMSLIKKLVPVGAIAMVAILVVGIGFFGDRNGDGSFPRQAYAKELVDLAKEQLTNLKAGAAIPNPTTGIVEWKTPDADGNIRDENGNIVFTTSPKGELVPVPREVPAVSETVTKDFALLLEEAHQAKDLAYIGDKILPDGKRVRVLHFTKEGRTVILGIDEKNLPVVKIVSDGNYGGGIILEQGEIKNDQPSFPSGQGIQYGKIDPNKPQPKNIDEMMNFWTENLENVPKEK